LSNTFTRATVEDVAGRVVHAIAGPHATPRPDQVEAVCGLLVDGRRTLVVQRTGWGKSAVYWIAAKAVREAGGGLVLVVSPLLALMRNQVESAKAAGLRAGTLNSSNIDAWQQIERDVLTNRLDILFVSPERLANPRFAREVFAVINDRLGLLVIDEAHCISSWGHDFRPDYQRIAGLLMANPTLPVLCTTATANKRVTTDVAKQLGDDTFVLRGQLARDSLHLSVITDLASAQHYAWVAEALRTLPGSGIVYTLTVEKVKRLAEFLNAQGHNVAAYYGEVPTEERLRIEDALMRNEIKAVVATSALGMGYDKPDLAFCLHVGCPGSPIDYYQQVGRAGRALDRATVALVTDQKADRRIWEWFATSNVPKQAEVDAIIRFLRKQGGEAKVTAIAAAAAVSRPRAELLLKILAVDGAVERLDDGWRALDSQWVFDASRYEALVLARRAEANRMAEYASASRCLETQLRMALDDDVDPTFACGRCSVCTGELPHGLSSRPDKANIVTAQRFLRGVDHPIEPRKRWAPGLVVPGLEMRNSTITQVSLEGRALAYGDDAAWSEAIDPLRFDGELSDELREGVREMLGRWRLMQTAPPTVVVPVPSSRRPKLVASIAECVARELSVPVVDALHVQPPAGSRGSATARPHEVAERITMKSGARLADERVLLVDDTTLTRWTLTIAGALLRNAGAKSVAPLVLHQLASADATEG